MRFCFLSGIPRDRFMSSHIFLVYMKNNTLPFLSCVVLLGIPNGRSVGIPRLVKLRIV